MTLSRTLSLFVLLSSLVFSLAAFFSYKQYDVAAQAQAVAHARDTLEAAAVTLNQRLQHISRDMVVFAAQPPLMEFGDMSPLQRYQVKDYVLLVMNDFALSRNSVISMKLHENGKSGIYSQKNALTLADDSLLIVYRDIIGEYGLDHPINQTIITRPIARDGRHLFGIAVPVFSSAIVHNDQTFQYCLLAICDYAVLSDVLPSTATPYYILHGSSVVLSNQTSDIPYKDGVQENDALLTHEIPSLELQVVTWLPNRGDEGVLATLRRYGISMSVFLLAVQFVLMVALRTKITRPIENIARQTNQIGAKMLRIENPDASRGELAVLARGMNDMVQRVTQLSKETAEAENKYLRERVMFLQTQMNPHFLFNNLECIRGMISMGNPGGVMRIVSAMAQIYRYCARRGSSVRLEEEMQCLQRYMDIISLRYSNAFVLTTSIAPDTLHMSIPSMVIQPLAENAIQHGFLHGGRKEGRIHVSSYREDNMLCVEIRDDGVGMSEEKMREINIVKPHKDEQHSHIGISNIQSRIRILCEEGSGLVYEISENAMLCARLRINGMRHTPYGTKGTPRD